MKMLTGGILASLISSFLTTTTKAAAPEPPLAEKYLQTGELKKGEKQLKKHLKANPQDDQARFGLAVIQLTQGVEHLTQSLYKYGLRQDVPRSLPLAIPFLRVPVPPNPQPEQISYEDFRKIFERIIRDLSRVEKTLTEMTADDVKMPLHFGLIRLDVNGDGKITEQETLWQLFRAINPRVARNMNAAQMRAMAAQFVIAFDKADVYWLQGYCHLLSGMAEVTLAHDMRGLFERTGHLLFTDVKSPYKFLKEGKHVWDWGNNRVDIADVIGFIHMINFPVTEPKRMEKALEHFHQVIATSRQSWKAIQAETDDDREWVPGPKQRNAAINQRVNEQMVTTWHLFLDEATLILDGKRLVRFPRSDKYGINVNKMFTQPAPFDLVMWLQGTGVQPFLEEGQFTSPENWRQFQQVFRGNFFVFAVWFN